MKIVNETVYISSDNKRFSTEKECIEYENLFSKRDGVYFLLTVSSNGNYPVGIFESFEEAKEASSVMATSGESKEKEYYFRIYRIQKNDQHRTSVETCMDQNIIELTN